MELLIPISQFDQEVQDMCKNPPAYVHLIKEDDDIYNYCGPDAVACIIDDNIYVPEGRLCPVNLAHELNHRIGYHFVDRPKTLGILAQ